MDKVAAWVTRGKFCRVALQFPADSISLAPKFAEELRAALGRDAQVFVLGDTSYGDCCVDEVGAEHYGADCVVHFGYSCQSAPLRLPTLLVPISSSAGVPISDSALEGWARGVAEKNLPVLVLADPDFRKFENSAIAHLKSFGVSEIYLAPAASQLFPGLQRNLTLRFSGISPVVSAAAACHFSPKKIFDRPLLKKTWKFLLPADSLPETIAVFFLGEQTSPLLQRAILNFPDESVFCGGWVSSGRLMARRFAGVEAVRRAERVGVLYAASSLAGVIRLREVISAGLRAQGKNVCGFCVGKLTDAKIGNFPEIDVFVVLGCPDFLNTEILTPENLRNFHCPMVSAFEAAVAADLLPWGVAADLSSLSMPADLEICNPLADLIDINSRGYSGFERSQIPKIPATIEPGLSGVPSRYVSELK